MMFQDIDERAGPVAVGVVDVGPFDRSIAVIGDPAETELGVLGQLGLHIREPGFEHVTQGNTFRI